MIHMTRIVLLVLFSSAVMAAANWHAVAGDYHVHIVPTQAGFEVHVHDKAKHLPVDLTRGKLTATLLRGGRTMQLPLSHHEQKGIMTSATPLTGKWTLLVRINLQGQKPAQARFASVDANNTKAKKNPSNEHDDHAHH
jgi:hypothetical protein